MATKLKVQTDDGVKLNASGSTGATFGVRDLVQVVQNNDYDDLVNKPSINGVELIGDKTTSDLGIEAGVTSWNGQTGDVVYTPPEVPVQSVNGRVGAVVLDAADVGALPSDTVIPDDANLVHKAGAETITGAKTFTNGVEISRPDSGAILKLSSSATDTNFILERTGGSQCVLESGAGVGLFGTKSNHPLQIRTNYTNRMTIGTDGTVKLVTAPPASSNDTQVATTKWVKDRGYAQASAIPSKTSQLTNDSGFITSASVPTKTSDLTNDSGYITAAAVPTNVSEFTNDAGYVNATQAANAAPVQSVNGQTGDVSLTIPTVPSNVSAFTNDAGYVNTSGAASAAPVQSVNGATGAVSLDAIDVGALPDDTIYALGQTAGGNAVRANGILYAQVDSTSTSKLFTATIPGVTEYFDGLTIMLKNGIVTSASGFTININGLGGKPAVSNMTAATLETTIFNINYTMLFVYDSTRVADGCWICYRGYDANTNTIGYQLRTNSSTLPASDKFYRYRLLFTSADGTHWVPANTSTSTNATASRTVNQRPIDPFGEIVYYGTTAAVEANANVSAAQLWQQYAITFGYSFNLTGAALVLPYPSPIYIKCAPQSDGSAIIDDTTPYVFDLPTTEDGKIYIYLGRTYSATAIELVMNHPVYYFKDGAIRLWTNAPSGAPPVTSADNGKVLMVVNGAWAAASLPIYNGGVS